VAEFMHESIVFCSACTMSSWKSSWSLSHLLMSFLYYLLCFVIYVYFAVRWSKCNNCS